MKSSKQRIIFRRSPSNRLSFPVLLNVWESHGIDREFDIIVSDHLPKLNRGDVIAYSFMTPHAPDIHAEIRQINRPDILIVGGGPHIRGDRELSFQMGFDVLFTGSGETAFLKFAGDLLDQRIKKERKIYPGSGGRDELNRYFPISRYMKTLPPLEIMRGCNWRCTYCQTHRQTPAYRDLDSIHRHLGKLKKNKCKRINFVSPSALEYGATKARQIDFDTIDSLLDMADSLEFELIEYGIFPSEIRPDTIDDKAVQILKKYVANRRLTLGAQSGSDRRLRELKRGHTGADIERAVDIVNAHGFLANLDFIFGYPGETPEERKQTISFIRRLHRKYRIRAQSHYFFPLPGSAYAFRFPSFLSAEEKENLLYLKNSGMGTDQWQENEHQVSHYFTWLKHHFPTHLDHYT